MKKIFSRLFLAVMFIVVSYGWTIMASPEAKDKIGRIEDLAHKDINTPKVQSAIKLLGLHLCQEITRQAFTKDGRRVGKPRTEREYNSDDISVYMTTGPSLYEKNKEIIWHITLYVRKLDYFTKEIGLELPFDPLEYSTPDKLWKTWGDRADGNTLSVDGTGWVMFADRFGQSIPTMTFRYECGKLYAVTYSLLSVNSRRSKEGSIEGLLGSDSMKGRTSELLK